MNKKNGFTLVELLAVIAIIAILAVTAVAGYNGMTDKSKEKAYQAKVQLIETSAIKWAKENNINNKTSISVNKLVVQGYLQADSINDEGIALIENPKDGSNMICNLVSITLENQEHSADYLTDASDCNLAYREEDASKIDIQAYEAGLSSVLGYEDGSNKLNWTNRNIGIVVNSSYYDVSLIKSVTYDYNGESVTKAVTNDGFKVVNSYSTISDAAPNCFKISSVSIISDSELTVTFTLTDGTTKSRTITVRIDKEEPTATIIADQEWMTSGKKIKVFLDDGNGSGAKKYYLSSSEILTNLSMIDHQETTDGYALVSKKLSVGTYYVFTEDIAGNKSTTPKAQFTLNNIDDTQPECTINFLGTVGDSGWYKSFVTPKATTNEAGPSGISYEFNTTGNIAYTLHASEGNIGEKTLSQETSETSGKSFYCFVKTAAGESGSKERTLKIDVTEPTLSLSKTSGGYAKEHTVTVKIKDNLSGLRKNNTIKYAWATSNTVAPTNWSTLTITGTNGTKSELSKDIKGSGFTGTYYLWIKAGELKDVAGNAYLDSAGNNYVSEAFLFDNTAPTNPTVTLCKWNGSSAPTSCASSTYTASSWSRVSVTSFVGGSTDAHSGEVYYQYTTTGRTTNNTNTRGVKRDIKAAGTSTIKWRACDKLNNCTGYTTAYIINLDSKAPTVPTSTIREDSSSGSKRTNADSWTNKTLWWGNFSSSDEDGVREVSGVDHFEYSTGCTGSRTGDLSSSYTYSTERNVKYCIRAVDKAGNASAWSSAYYFKIDKTGPKCYMDSDHSYSTHGVNYIIVCYDEDGGSGIYTCADTRSDVMTFYNRKTDVTRYVLDNAGNRGACSLKVNSVTDYRRRTRTWNSCKTGSSNACVGGYVSDCITGVYNSARQCKIIEGDDAYWVSSTKSCCRDVWSDCASRTNTCSGGWNSWGAWTGYGNYSCSGYSSNACELELRTRYY